MKCRNKLLRFVPENIPYETTDLQLTSNKLTQINENDFRNCSRLVSLDLSLNEISVIHQDAFKSLLNLKILRLSECVR